MLPYVGSASSACCERCALPEKSVGGGGAARPASTVRGP